MIRWTCPSSGRRTVLVACTMCAPAIDSRTRTVDPCTTEPLAGETIDSFAVLLGRAPLVDVVGDAAEDPPPQAASSRVTTSASSGLRRRMRTSSRTILGNHPDAAAGSPIVG